jgi:glycosyltransferase involved in cell wall biosynthesis
MKICFLSEPYYLHTRRWARFFADRGHDVHIVAGGPDIDARPLRDVTIHPLDDQPFRGPWILRTTFALRRLLKRLRPDILHMHFLWALPAPIFLQFRPFLVSVWGADILGKPGRAPDGRRERFFKTLILRRADAVTALSGYLAAATCRYARLHHDRVSICPWGVDLEQFQPVSKRLRSPEGAAPIVIGFVKHLEAKYGPEYLLRAIPEIRARHSAIKVVLLGEGGMKRQLEDLCHSLGIADVVDFVGGVAHDQVPDYMGSMDIFVMPSVHDSETLGVAAIEAQAMGLPVVATRIGGIPEAVVDERTGLLVPPRDAVALARAGMRLIENPELRQSMSREGRRFVAQRYDWHKNAGRVEALYADLLSRMPQGH